MSDIPVGSPPAPPGRHAAPGGWYPDPLDLSRERYWDGWQWSRTTRASEVAAPVGGPTAYAPGPRAAYGGVPATPRPVPTTADGVPLAGWWWRALAGLLDALLVGTVTGLATLPFYSEAITAMTQWWAQAWPIAQAGGQPPPTPNVAALVSGADRLLVGAIAFVLGMAYHAPLIRRRGATLGMTACSLRVVPVDEGRSQTPLPWSRVVLRAALWVLPGALSFRFLTVADVLLPLWHPKRQTLHDLAAQTQVVRLR